MEIITMVSEYILGAMSIVFYILLLIIGVLLGFALCIVLVSWIIEIIGMIQDIFSKDGEQ